MTQKETPIEALIDRLEQALEYAARLDREFIELYQEEVEDCIDLLYEYKDIQS